MTAPKAITLNLPVSSFKMIRLFTNKLTTDEKCTQFSFIMQLVGAEPENTGDQCKIISLALVFMNTGGKVRAGFLRRCQIIAKP